MLDLMRRVACMCIDVLLIYFTKELGVLRQRWCHITSLRSWVYCVRDGVTCSDVGDCVMLLIFHLSSLK